jgi:hypothetical protein
MLGRRDVLRLAGAAATILAAPAIVTAQSRPKLRIGLGPQQPTQADTKRVFRHSRPTRLPPSPWPSTATRPRSPRGTGLKHGFESRWGHHRRTRYSSSRS